MTSVKHSTTSLRPPARVSRRGLCRRGARAAVGAVAATQLATPLAGAEARPPPALSGSARQRAAFRIREDAAGAWLYEMEPFLAANGDEEGYADKRASFAK